MLFTSVLAERETPVIVDTSNVAVSENPLGGPPAVQLLAVFQSPVAAVACHEAFPAKVVLCANSKSGSVVAARSKDRAQGRVREVEQSRP